MLLGKQKYTDFSKCVCIYCTYVLLIQRKSVFAYTAEIYVILANDDK